MAGRDKAVFGLYRDQAHVEEGVQALKLVGFGPDDISVLFSDERRTEEFSKFEKTRAEAATSQAANGVLGWLAGVNPLAIPGAGGFWAAGPILARLSGAGAGGTLAGLFGTLIGLNVPEETALRYEGRLRDGGVLLHVHVADDDAARAKEVLEETGADDIAVSAETEADPPTPDERPFDQGAPELPASTEEIVIVDDTSSGSRRKRKTAHRP